MKWIKQKLTAYVFLAFVISVCMGLNIGNDNLVYAQSSIPTDAYSWNGHSYMLYMEPMTIFSAQSFCKSLGGHLLEIQSSEEMGAIRQYRSQKNVSNIQLWLGAIKTKAGDWTWMSGNSGEKKVYAGDGITSYEVAGKRFSSTDKNVYPQYSSWKSYYAYIESINLSQVTHGFICEWDEEVENKTSVANATVSLSSGVYTYDGKAKKPAVTVTLKGKSLKQGTDYTVSYVNNVNIGTAAQVMITGKGNYTGSKLELFKIIPKTPSISLSSSDYGEIVVRSSEISGAAGYEYEYRKSGSTTKKIVRSTKRSITLKGLTADETYIVKVRAYKTVDGTNVYGGYSSSKSQKVYKGKPISAATVSFKSPNSSYVYNGKPQKPAIVVKMKSGVITTTLKKDKDYTVSYNNHINAGTATIVVTGKGKYYGTVKKKFVIGQAALTSKSITLSKTSHTYTTKEIRPEVIVTGITATGTTVPITKSDYSVSYKNNINAGTASVIVKGKNNFTGIVKKTFTIKKLNLSKCTIEMPNGESYPWKGNGIEVRPEISVKYGNYQIPYDEKNTFSLKYSNNMVVGTAKVTVTGVGNLDGSKVLEFQIEKKFQMPLKDAYCTWSGYNASTWSWGESRTGMESNTDRIYHVALDLGPKYSTVYSISDGRVLYTGYQSANGNYVVIEHTMTDGKKIYSFYAHMSNVTVSSGDHVSCGDTIGTAGNTGTACPDNAPHLHFSIVDTAKKGSYDGYCYKYELNGNTAYHNQITYYNPKYVIENGKLP